MGSTEPVTLLDGPCEGRIVTVPQLALWLKVPVIFGYRDYSHVTYVIDWESNTATWDPLD